MKTDDQQNRRGGADKEKRARAAAAAIWEAWSANALLDQLPEDCRPGNDLEGHLAQAMLSGFSGPSYGWKIAATSTAGQRHIGIAGPIAGRLFERFRHESGVTLFGTSHMGVVEAEFAFRLGRDLDASETIPIEEARSAVDAMYLAIEIPDSRFARFETVGSAHLIADDSCAGRVVLGGSVPRWETLELATQETQIRVDDAIVAEGVGANVLGAPDLALTWLANDLRDRGEYLRAGDLVMTGTTTVPAPIGPGSRVVAKFIDLGEVSFEFGT